MITRNRLQSNPGHSYRKKPVPGGESMKANYDFSKAERGKFYHADAVFGFPVYLESDVNEFLSELAEQKKIDIQDLVNELLRADIHLIQSIQ
jgi:hypothetical protein